LQATKLLFERHYSPASRSPFNSISFPEPLSKRPLQVIGPLPTLVEKSHLTRAESYTQLKALATLDTSLATTSASLTYRWKGIAQHKLTHKNKQTSTMGARSVLLSTSLQQIGSVVMTPTAPILWFCKGRNATIEVQATNLLYTTSLNNTNEANDGKKFRCPFTQSEEGSVQHCSFICKTNVDLLRHELGAHSDYRPFVCTEPDCNSKGFKQKSALTTHMNSIHRGVRYSCICKGGPGPTEKQWTFGDPSALARHIRTAERKGEPGHGVADSSSASSGQGSSEERSKKKTKRDARQEDLPAQSQHEQVNNEQHWDVDVNTDLELNNLMEQPDVFNGYIPVDPALDNFELMEIDPVAPMGPYDIKFDEQAGEEFGWPAATEHGLQTRNSLIWAGYEKNQIWTEEDEKDYWHLYYHGMADDMFCMSCRPQLED
jgi:hypothetical protein